MAYNSEMFTDIIIMAGGSGSRLWPASNSRSPKQFLSLPEGGTFFDAALTRGFAVLDPGADGALVVVAGESHVSHIVRACAALPEAQRARVVLIPEPVARNTGPAIACAAVYLERTYGAGRSALVLTSDHVIEPLERFRDDAAAAAALAHEDQLVFFGIPPRGPETGYGYIEAGAAITSSGRGYALASFREKPDLKTAENFLAQGGYFWNSGMFGFPVDLMLGEFRRSAPATLAPFDALGAPDRDAYRLQDGVSVLAAWQGLREAYQTVAGVSIDYAVAEKCPRAAVVAASFDWLDIGSWDEYARFMGTGTAEVYQSGSAGCYVDSDLPVALCGVQDLVVVVRSGRDGGPASVLVCRKGQTQRVKDLVGEIKAAGRTELL